MRRPGGGVLRGLAVSLILVIAASPGAGRGSERRHTFESVLRAYQERYFIVRGVHSSPFPRNHAGEEPGPFPADGFYQEVLEDGGLESMRGVIDSMWHYLFEGVQLTAASWKGTLAHRFLSVPSVEGLEPSEILALTVAESDRRDWSALRQSLSLPERVDLIVERLGAMRYYYKPLSVVEAQTRHSPPESYAISVGVGGAVQNALEGLSPWSEAFIGGTAPTFTARDVIGLTTGRISAWIDDVRVKYACDLSRARGRAQAYLYVTMQDPGGLYGEGDLGELVGMSGLPVVPDGRFHAYVGGPGGGVLRGGDWVGRGPPFLRSAAPMSIRFEMRSEGRHREDYPEALASSFGPLVIVDLDLEHPIAGIDGDECACATCEPGALGTLLDGDPVVSVSLGNAAAEGGEALPAELRVRMEWGVDQVLRPEALVAAGPGSRAVGTERDPAGDVLRFRAGAATAEVIERRADGFVLEVSAGGTEVSDAGGGGAAAPDGGVVTIRVARVAPGDSAWIDGTEGVRVTREIDGGVRESHVFRRDAVGGAWTLRDESARTEEVVVVEAHPDELVDGSVETATRHGADGIVVDASRVETRRFPWGEAVERVVEGEGEGARVTTFTYHADPADPGSYGRVSLESIQGAGWTLYRYDPAGRVILRASGLGDTLPPADGEDLPLEGVRVVETAYSPAPGGGTRRTIVERVAGHEISRRYVEETFLARREIVCRRPGASVDDPGNLVTLTEFQAAGAFAGEVRRIVFPDGTIEWREPLIDDEGRRVETTWTGVPSPDGGEVVAGLKRVRVIGRSGHAIEERTEDVETGIVVSGMRATAFDAFGRPVARIYSDGTTDAVTYGCCGVASRTGRDGMVTAYLREVPVEVPAGIAVDGLPAERVVPADGTTTAGVTRWRAKVGRTVLEWFEGADGSTRPGRIEESDASGRVTRILDPAHGETRVEESIDPAGRMTRRTVHPWGGEEIERHHRDGSLAEVSGSATVPRRFAVGSDRDGEWFRQETELDAAGQPSGRWRREVIDMVGNVVRVEEGSGVAENGVAVWTFDYDARGRIVRAEDPTGVISIAEHDPLGRATVRGIDIDRDGRLDPAGADPMRRSVLAYGFRADGAVPVERVVREVWTDVGDPQPVETETDERALDRDARWAIRDGGTWETVTTRSAGGDWSIVRTNPDGSRDEWLHGGPAGPGRLLQEASYDADGEVVTSLTYARDPFGAVSGIDDALGRTTGFVHDDAGRLLEIRRPSPAGGLPDGEAEVRRYDAAGRVSEIALPGGSAAEPHRIRLDYDAAGRVSRRDEDRGPSIAFSYDPAGRLVGIERGAAVGADGGPSSVAFGYDPASGRLDRRTEADGGATVLERDAAGRLVRRIDARGTVTEIAYDGAGRPIGLRYSDGTPGVDLVLSRDGLPIEVRDAAGVRTMRYDRSRRRSGETIEGGVLGGVACEWDRDGIGRLIGRAVRIDGAAVGASYGYDARSRLQRVASGLAEVGARFRSGAVNQPVEWEAAFDGGPVLRRALDRDHLGLPTAHSAAPADGIDPWISRTIVRDASGRRTETADAGGMRTRYAYHPSGRLARRDHLDPSGEVHERFDFEYGDFGLRRTAVLGHPDLTVGIEPDPADPARAGAIDRPGVVEVRGSVKPDAALTVGGLPVPVRPDGSFRALVPVAGPGARRVDLEIEATVDGESESVALARLAFAGPASCRYDAAGNLVSDGWRTFEWDAENRLVAVELGPETVDPPEAAYRIENRFDAVGRRISRRFFRHVAGQWLLAEERKFVHDGWRLVAEFEGDGDLLRSYVWGNDLSGTPDGAGGAGGLRIVNVHRGPAAGTYFAIADTMGNVVGLVDAESGELAGRYAYDPFGRLLEMTGPAAPENPLRFATKYHDEVAELLDFGLRFLDPTLGRWLSRDPIRESGGPDLYGFVGDDPVNQVDLHGLALYAFDGTGNTFDQMTHVGMLFRSYLKERRYLDGVGTYLNGPLDNKVVGGLTGYGGQRRIERMYQSFRALWENGDREVDIIGFSRGAALAREFANLLHERGYKPPPKGRNRGPRNRRECPQKEDVAIRFVGLFDTVPSFGVPGNEIDLGYRLDVPPNVGHAAHALSLDEKRGLFPLVRLNRPVGDQTFKEAWFAGDHSDIGGGWLEKRKQNLLANPPLAFIWSEGRSVGVPFGDLPERKLVDSLVPNDNGGIGHDFVFLSFHVLHPLSFLWNEGKYNPNQPRDIR